MKGLQAVPMCRAPERGVASVGPLCSLQTSAEWVQDCMGVRLYVCMTVYVHDCMCVWQYVCMAVCVYGSMHVRVSDIAFCAGNWSSCRCREFKGHRLLGV